MSKRTFALAFIIVLSAAGLAAQNLKIAVMDFTLESDNPQFKYLGKGFTELVSVEVARLPGFVLVDRERRNAILEEQEFALSGAADASGAMEIGQLLSVDYFIVGSIIDMMGNLMVSYSIIRTDTGAVVGKQVAEGSPKDYKRIVKAISLGIATMAGRESAIAKAQAAPALAAPVARQEEVLTSFSDAVAALDVKDVKTAAAKLKVAKSIDPTDRAVQFYMDKLASGSAKFKVVPERYVSYYNPAYLGGMTKDRLYFNTYSTSITGGLDGPNHPLALDDTENLAVWEEQSAIAFGYAYPLSDTLSVSIDGSITHRKEAIEWFNPAGFPIPVFEASGSQELGYYGGFVGFGYALGSNISIGVAVGASYISRKYYYADGSTNNGDAFDPYDQMEYWGYGGLLAAAARNDAGSVAWDVVAGLGMTPSYLFDNDLLVFEKKSDPLYVEQTLSLAFNDKTTIVGLKQVNDIYLDRTFYYGRLMPCAEQWFFDLFSVRAGVEGTMLLRGSGLKLGWGATGGLTLRLWHFDLDLNYTYRQRPSYSREEIVVPESVLFFTVSMNGLLKN